MKNFAYIASDYGDMTPEPASLSMRIELAKNDCNGSTPKYFVDLGTVTTPVLAAGQEWRQNDYDFHASSREEDCRHGMRVTYKGKQYTAYYASSPGNAPYQYDLVTDDGTKVHLTAFSDKGWIKGRPLVITRGNI